MAQKSGREKIEKVIEAKGRGSDRGKGRGKRGVSLYLTPRIESVLFSAPYRYAAN